MTYYISLQFIVKDEVETLMSTLVKGENNKKNNPAGYFAHNRDSAEDCSAMVKALESENENDSGCQQGDTHPYRDIKMNFRTNSISLSKKEVEIK